ncbi:MAG: rod-binding protein [Planctomycetota bacterium]|nr:rod-binding protein [Planctomycetota bacterium]
MQSIGTSTAGLGNMAATSMQDNLQKEMAQKAEALRAGDGPTTEAEIEDAANQMESLFASMLVKEMRGSMSKGLFGEGPGADIYNEWFDRNMGEAIAADGGLGMAGMLKVQLGVEAASKHSALKGAEGEQS